MLVRGRGSPEPGVIGDRYQEVRTPFNESPGEIRKDNLKADEDAKFALGQGKIEDLVPGFEVSDTFPQRSDEEK
jgi:hypothetical protein